MQYFITTLLGCSAAMAAVSLVFLAMDKKLGRRYSAGWMYAIWLVIVCCFIIPWRPPLPNTGISIESVRPIFDNITQAPAAEAAISEFSVVQEAMATPPAWYEIAFYIWLVGAAALLIISITRHLRFCKTLKRWSEGARELKTFDVLCRAKRELGISKNIGIKVCHTIGSPTLTGLLRPRILLPSEKIPETELYFIIKHELVHYKHRDLWFKALMLLANTLHWFNPAVYAAVKAASLQAELACDEAVAKGRPPQEKQLYTAAILKAAVHGQGLPTALATNFYGGRKNMEKRISTILSTKKKRIGALLLCGVIALVLLTGSMYAQAAPPSESGYDIYDENPYGVNYYQIYEKYGLTYDLENDLLYYNGQAVRYFEDRYYYLEAGQTIENANAWSTNEHLQDDGQIDVYGVRDADQILTGVRVASQNEFDQMTSTLLHPDTTNIAQASSNDFEAANTTDTAATADAATATEATPVTEVTETNYDQSVSTDGEAYSIGQSASAGTAQDVENSVIEADSPHSAAQAGETTTSASSGYYDPRETAKTYSIYEPFGLSFDIATERLYYNGQLVKYFEDIIQEHADGSLSIRMQSFNDGEIQLRAVRDGNGNLTGIEEYSDSQKEEFWNEVNRQRVFNGKSQIIY